MASKKYSPKFAEGTEIPVSVLGINQRDELLWIARESVGPSNFPPCITRIIKNAGSEKGMHRKAAILAAFLGQVGYSEVEAKLIWSKAIGAPEKIFAEWFQKMHCPKCETLRRNSRGYPELGISDLGLCQPDALCEEFEGPVEYACRILSEDDKQRGSDKHIKIQYRALVFDWASGREEEIELSENEKGTLEALLLEKAVENDEILAYTMTKIRGKLRPKFILKKSNGLSKHMLSDLL